MDRRQFISGSSVLAIAAGLPRDVEALTVEQRAVLLGGTAARPSWVLLGSNGQPAKFQRNAALSQYWFNGRVYLSDAALNAAAGGVNSGASRIYGPYIDPTNTNFITNGDFSGGTTGWAAVGTGASIAVVGGELETTSGGSLNAYSQGVSGTLGLAFRLTGTGRQGTSTNSFFLVSAISSALSGNNSVSGFTTTSNVTRSMLCSGVADTTYFGVRNSSGVGAGTGYFDNFSLIQAWPLQNWTPSAITVLVEATTPSSTAADEVIWQSDAQTERDRIRLVRLVADNHIHLIVTSNNNAQADLDLGAVAASTAFSIAFSCAQNSFSASLNGGAPVTDVAGVCPGAAIMQIGKSFTGNAWTGTDPFVAVF